ncbi:fumarylacetoacetate hydrolase family protein [Aquamicrobium sp. LC103]|uniref:fumarylacetoacetate hydrolase family protein n=1 Tax=Aquamicrobium sp. LC103 TaxID=1120658 RepID=UPI00063EA04F|nr:fumarylacetoacetate hydrolase family protein [Aquamicrobium sp. LC103]TKT82556.1 fumarylacetoacetate hydrolase family protein [Aquamicrobium sp. LC103]
MKLATYENGPGNASVAIVHSGNAKLFDLRLAAERAGRDASAFASMISLMDAGKAGLDAAHDLFDRHGGGGDLSVDVSSVRLLAPVPEPRQMRDGMSFPLHIRQSPRGMRKLLAAGDPAALAAIEAEPLADLPEVYRKLPIYYITNRMIVAGPEDTVRWPAYSKVMDYELEIGVFVGRTGTNIPASKAAEHIFGYTIFNDLSARDQQAMEMPGWLGPAKGKSFNGGNVLGPWIVTPDEIGDPYALAMEARINGETVARGRSEGMLFSFEELIAHMSRDETVFAGEFIGSGTVGNGCGLENGHFLSHGDTIELEIEKIGTLRNKIVRQDA